MATEEKTWRVVVSDKLAEGDIIKVKVLEVDLDRRRIALSRKQVSGVS